jgi:two-component system response regulator MprA
LTKSSEPPLILFADDHHDTRKMYADYFRLKGFRVADAADGVAAVELAKRLRPSLIVLDAQMPQLDGIAATRLLRRHQQLRETPILILTAYDFLEEEVLKAGATSVCVKPCAPDKLLDEIRMMLART